MKIVLKLLQLLISLANTIKGSRLRVRLRKQFENEGAVFTSKKLARAYEALRRVAHDRSDPNKLHENDGHRRD